MIIDAHVHLGPDKVYGRDCSEDDLLQAIKNNNIDCIIVQPGHDNTGIKATQRAHDRIARFCKEHKEQAYGMCSINPHFAVNIYKTEARRCINDFGFVGIKVHSITHAWCPLLIDGYLPFETAEELNVPLMIHTGSGFPYSYPDNILPMCKEFPIVKIILAHATRGVDMLISECPNTYIETSSPWGWIRPVQGFVKKYGAQRIMFGSNGPDEMESALYQYKIQMTQTALIHYGINPCAPLTEEELEWCLGKTAATVFDILYVDGE